MVIRGLTCDRALSPWVLWCGILLPLYTLVLILWGGSCFWVCFVASFSPSFPVGCCFVIRGSFVVVRLLENGIFAKCTSHRHVKKRALRIGVPTAVAACIGASINQM